MSINKENYHKILSSLQEKGVSLVAVSKMQPEERLLALYQEGQRDFGENYVQELIAKQQSLPADIRWHFIGHLQSNKVKYIAPFVHLVHGVESLKLLREVDKQAKKAGRTIEVLLQVHIASEDSKFGLDENELNEIMVMVRHGSFQNVTARGLMGMASFSEDTEQVRKEFHFLHELYQQYFKDEIAEGTGILSMGMSGDYEMAIEEGSNMVRIGSLLFGRRG
jgi:PLP dependent protein